MGHSIVPVTVRLSCDNEDSCAPGTTHLFPEEGQVVTVCAPVQVRAVGSDSESLLDWLPNQSGIVQVIHPEWHQVIAAFGGQRVWLDIDDIDLATGSL